MTNRKVAVIGAGVSGLTTAIVLLVDGGYDVEVFAEKIGIATTSSRAAAIWFPYHIGKADDEQSLKKVKRWACKTFTTLRKVMEDPHSGVSMIEFRVITKKEQKLALPKFDCVEAVELGAEKVKDPWLSGYGLDVPLIDSPIYLNYLEERLGRERIHVGRRINRIADLDSVFSIVVNCAGIEGPRMSRKDRSPMRPGRGVVLNGRSSLPYAVLDADDSDTTHQLTYIVPRRVTGTYIVGGCDTPDWNETTGDDEGRKIFERCSAVDPSLRVDNLTGMVGLRPTREDGVYLKHEEIDGRDVIHNYGHGGGGFTVSWGCANEVLGLVRKLA